MTPRFFNSGMATIAEHISRAKAQLGNGQFLDAFMTLRNALPLAQLSGDHANTITIAEALQSIVATYGNTEQQSGSNRTKIEWEGESLSAIIRRARIAQSSTLGISTQTVEYKATSS